MLNWCRRESAFTGFSDVRCVCATTIISPGQPLEPRRHDDASDEGAPFIVAAVFCKPAIEEMARLHSLQDTTSSCQASSSANDVIAPHDGHSAMSSATAWCGRMTRKNSLCFFPSFESLASMLVRMRFEQMASSASGAIAARQASRCFDHRISETEVGPAAEFILVEYRGHRSTCLDDSPSGAGLNDQTLRRQCVIFTMSSESIPADVEEARKLVRWSCAQARVSPAGDTLQEHNSV